MCDESRNNFLVMEAYDALMTNLLKTHQTEHSVSEDEIYRILKAAEFAAESHQNQTRLDVLKTALYCPSLACHAASIIYWSHLRY